MSRDLHNHIIEQAIPLFARYGYRKTSVDDLARAAEVSKATLYQYFESKEKLFAQAVHHEKERLIAIILNEIAAAKNPKAKLRAYFTGYLKAIANSQAHQHATHEALLEILPLARNEIDSSIHQGEIALVEILQQGIETKDFVIPDLDMTLGAIKAFLKGLDCVLVDPSQFSLFEKTLPHLIDILIRGLEKGSH